MCSVSGLWDTLVQVWSSSDAGEDDEDSSGMSSIRNFKMDNSLPVSCLTNTDSKFTVPMKNS
jgi:hypothetical protein